MTRKATAKNWQKISVTCFTTYAPIADARLHAMHLCERPGRKPSEFGPPYGKSFVLAFPLRNSISVATE